MQNNNGLDIVTQYLTNILVSLSHMVLQKYIDIVTWSSGNLTYQSLYNPTLAAISLHKYYLF